MSRTIAAIETHYHGFRFRSRIEARWAVFFDHLGWEWRYEPEGFTLADGTNYLPDFEILDDGLEPSTKRRFIEVKGQVPSSLDMFKTWGLAKLLSCDVALVFGDPVDALHTIGSSGMMMFGGKGAVIGFAGRWYPFLPVCSAARAARAARFEFGESG